jgi:hypothetical protein
MRLREQHVVKCNSGRHVLVIVLALFCLWVMPVQAQLVDDMEDESRFYAESKQVNQFFRRFNGEEDEKGKRYYPGDKHYRSNKLRKSYMGMLFDANNTGMPSDLKVDFVKQVLDKGESSVLDFHGNNWFAEVQCMFTLGKASPQPVTLYMELEKSHLGYKWVIQNVHAEWFDTYFQRDTNRIGRFLHPLSHELDFMNLRKAFQANDSISQFTVKRFNPNHLTLFLYEMKRGNLKFSHVNSVKFHFFQIKDWYFELAHFNRPGNNTGWLISNLVKLNSEADKDLMKRYLYHETK